MAQFSHVDTGVLLCAGDSNGFWREGVAFGVDHVELSATASFCCERLSPKVGDMTSNDEMAEDVMQGTSSVPFASDS